MPSRGRGPPPGKPRRVRDELAELGVRPSRKRGQSFLTDERVAQRQVMAAGVGPGDAVLEIGGGLGILTRQLAARGARVRVVEIEPALAERLRQLELPGVRVEEADARKADLAGTAKVVANLPYSLSSALVERLVRAGPDRVVLLLQREFAQRLAASPGSKAWSRLGAIVQRDFEVELLEDVPPNAFSPQPEVHSSMVRLTKRDGSRASSRKDYRLLVGRLFAARRKKIRNTVPGLAPHFRIGRTDAVRAAEALGFADLRPEELSCDDFEALCVALASRRTHK